LKTSGHRGGAPPRPRGALRGDRRRVLSWVAELNDETLGLIRSRLSEEAPTEAFERGRRVMIDEAVVLTG